MPNNNSTAHKTKISNLLASLSPTIKEKLDSHQINIPNLQYGGVEDHSKSALENNVEKFIEKLYVNNNTEKADDLEDLVFFHLESENERNLETNSLAIKTLNFLLEISGKDFVFSKFDLKPEDWPSRNVQKENYHNGSQEGSEMAESLEYEEEDFAEKSLSEWSEVSEEVSKSEKIEEESNLPNENLDNTLENELIQSARSQQKNHMLRLQAAEILDQNIKNNVFAIPEKPQKFDERPKIYITELDACTHILRNLLSGGKGISKTTLSPTNREFQLFKFKGGQPNNHINITTSYDDNDNPVEAIDGNFGQIVRRSPDEHPFKIIHLSTGCLDNFLAFFSKYINLTRNILFFINKITKSENSYKYNLYVNEILAILSFEYEKFYHIFELYYSKMISFQIPANLCQMKLFLFKKSKTLLRLWRLVENCFVNNGSNRLSHQQRYGKILNEFYGLKNMETVCGRISKFDEFLEGEFGPNCFHEVMKFEEDEEDKELTNGDSAMSEQRSTTSYNSKIIDNTQNQDLSLNETTFTTYWGRLFKLWQSSIDIILRGNYNPRLKPIEISMKLNGRFWDVLKEKTELRHLSNFDVHNVTTNINNTTVLEKTMVLEKDDILLDKNLRMMANNFAIATTFIKLAQSLNMVCLAKLRKEVSFLCNNNEFESDDQLDEDPPVDSVIPTNFQQFTAKNGLIVSCQIKNTVEKLIYSEMKFQAITQLKLFMRIHLCKNGTILEDVFSGVQKVKDNFENKYDRYKFISNIYNDWFDHFKIESEVDVENRIDDEIEDKLRKNDVEEAKLQGKNKKTVLKSLLPEKIQLICMETTSTSQTENFENCAQLFGKLNFLVQSTKNQPFGASNNLDWIINFKNLVNEWPLNSIVSPEDQVVYSTVFRIVQIFRTFSMKLTNLNFEDKMTDGKISFTEAGEKLPTFPKNVQHRLEILKSKNLHFLNTILQYITLVVLNPYLSVFDTFLESTESLTQLYLAHHELVKRIAKHLAIPSFYTFYNENIAEKISSENLNVSTADDENIQRLYQELSFYQPYDERSNSTVNNTTICSANNYSQNNNDVSRKLEALAIAVWHQIFRHLDVIDGILNLTEFSDNVLRNLERDWNVQRKLLSSMVENLRKHCNLPFLTELMYE